MPAVGFAVALIHLPRAVGNQLVVVFPLRLAVMDGAHAQFQFFVEEARADIKGKRIFRLQGLEEAAEAEAAFQAFGYALQVIVEFEGDLFVANRVFQAVSTAEGGEEAAAVEAALQLHPLADCPVVLDHAAVHIGCVDLVFDFIAVVGEAEVALAQLGEMRGEIEIVADFPVGAFFGF